MTNTTNQPGNVSYRPVNGPVQIRSESGWRDARPGDAVGFAYTGSAWYVLRKGSLC